MLYPLSYEGNIAFAPDAISQAPARDRSRGVVASTRPYPWNIRNNERVTNAKHPITYVDVT